MKKVLVFAIILVFVLHSLSGCTSNTVAADDLGQSVSSDEFEPASVKMQRVDSSAISELGYSKEHSVLLIRFLESGQLYAYYDVPESVYRSLKSAKSIGGYFNERVKGQYEYKRVGG